MMLHVPVEAAFRLTASILLAASLCCSGDPEIVTPTLEPPVEVPDEPGTPTPTQKLDLQGFLDSVAGATSLNGTAAVRVGDELVATGSYGSSSFAPVETTTDETVFRIGSVTKPFTATAIMILIESGDLSLDDRISDFIGSAPASWDSITIEQVLSHRSGIMHSWALPQFGQTIDQARDLDELIDMFKGQPLVFQPGTSMQYSGVGHFILARIVEEVSGLQFHEFLDEQIFDPVGMVNTGGGNQPEDVTRHADGYAVQGGTRQAVGSTHYSNLVGGGDLYSTAIDMVAFGQAMNEGQLLTEASLALMYAPRGTVVPGWQYGLGWIIPDADATQLLHSGGVPGFTSNFMRIPSENLSIMLMTNVTGQTNLGQVANLIIGRLRAGN